MIVPARRQSPRSLNYRRSGVWPGLGYTAANGAWIPDPKPPEPTYQNCVGANGAIDSACVARNSALNAAWLTATDVALYGPTYANSDFSLQTQSQAQANRDAAIQAQQAQAIQAQQAQAIQDAAIQAQSAVVPVQVQRTQVNPIESRNAGRPQSTITTPVPVSVLTPSATTPNGSVIVTSSGAQSAAVVPPASSGFDFSSIPTWGWLAAVGVALFAFGGQGGR